jgi:hypothetical protein
MLGIATPGHAVMPEAFTAVYNVEKSNTLVGRATYQLQHDSDDAVHFSQRTELAGFISLIRDDRLEEDSWLNLHDMAWRVTKYRYEQSGSKKNQNTLVSINWPEDSAQAVYARGQYADKDIQLEVKPGIRDALSFQLTLMQDATCDDKALSYSVITKGEIKHYHFERVREETLQIRGLSFSTQVVERKHDAHTVTRLWLARDFQNIPLRVARLEDGELDSEMTIDKLVVDEVQILQ